MANNLTGDFDAVVQVAVRQINGLLATLHENGAVEDATLKLLHSASVRVGDPGRRRPDLDVFGDWVREYQTVHPPVGVHDLRAQLTGMAPAGAAKRFEDAFSGLGEIFIPPDVVRGTAKVQVSSVTLSLPNGSTSEVTVHVHVRAHYTPDPGTTDMPQPVHGEVRAVFEVHKQAGGSRLVIRPSAQDSKIEFIAAPGSGLSGADAGKIAAQVRKALRESITLLPVDLPPDFAFADFKGVGTGTEQAVALPLQLSGGSPPPGGIQGVVNSFVGTGGFAFGIGKEFVKSVFQPTLDNLMQFKRSFTISVPIWFDPTYHFSVTGADLQFNDRTIDLVIRGKATTTAFGWSDYNNIVIEQRFALLMLFDTLTIQASDYEPQVSGLSSRAVGAVKNAVIAQRNQALPPAQHALNQQLRDARAKFTRALRELAGTGSSARFRAGFSEDAASSTSGGVAITPDGVIIRGDIRTGTTPRDPIVEITEIEPGKTYSALNSWIPGGRIERLVWSWVEGSPIVGWGGQVKSHTDEHRFLVSIPAPQPGPGPGPGPGKVITEVCLRLEGSRTLPDGSVQPVVAGTTCHVLGPEVIMNVPSWWEPVTVPMWLPDLRDDIVARDAIAGHITVQTERARKDELTHNSLVHFADWRSDAPLEALGTALTQLVRKSVSLVVFVVLPPGTFGSRRRELEAKLASIGERVSVPLRLTEDDEGGWTRTFAAAQIPATHLIDARRKLVWSHEGKVDAKVLAAALNQHITPAPIPRPRPLRLLVAPGGRAPDAFFTESRGEQFALHRMRGRHVLLNFWQSWSAPCLIELRRLQLLYERGVKKPPFIVAFHGGNDGTRLEEVRKQLGLSFALVQDEEQQVARKYGVRCWPTTVSIDAGGHVQHVQFGISPERQETPDRTPVQAT